MVAPIVLIYGNPVDGFAYVGPFNSSNEAHNYGEWMGYPEYWLSELEQVPPIVDGEYVDPLEYVLRQYANKGGSV
jgi:hypothetical protein